MNKSFTAQTALLPLMLCMLMMQNIFSQGKKLKPNEIDVAPFMNSAGHWYYIWAPDNVIEPLKDRPQYLPDDFIKIADNMLLFQKINGGWPKNYDMRAILTGEQKEKVIKAKSILNTTFDNWTTHSHVEYLARVYEKTGIKKYKEACLRGIDFILSAQYHNGGWPQFYPDTTGYAKYITFNDGVMTGIMKTLYAIAEKEPRYYFVDNALRDRAVKAFNKGIECILKCQIEDNGILTAWGQQHDNKTLKPQWARTFEPASICNGESADIVLFLMSIKNPSAKIINSIRRAVEWFNNSRIEGIRIETKSIAPVKYKYSTISHDRFVVNDPKAPPVWARFYELGTHKPLFCNRDGKVVYSFAEVLQERRASYGWYTYEPQEVIDTYSSWQKKWVKDKNISGK